MLSQLKNKSNEIFALTSTQNNVRDWRKVNATLSS